MARNTISHTKRIILSIWICSISQPALSAFDETYKLAIGSSINDFDTSLSINSRDGTIDKEIDLEDKLGFDQRVRLTWARGDWRIADKHRLGLAYTQINRSSELTSQNDISVDGNIILAGANLSSSVKTHVFDIEYIYSFYKRHNIELGVTAGIYWMNSLAEVAGSGNIILEGEDQDKFFSDFSSNQRLIAPLPLIGLTADYAVSDSWILRGSARYFSITINDIDGYLLNMNLAAEYSFNKHFGAGLSASLFDVRVDHRGIITNNSLNYKYNGVLGFIVIKY
jgi:hypothetical protein